jgi:hypothetical protein
MDQVEDLQTLNTLLSSAGSQEEAALSNQGGGSEVFPAIFNEIEAQMEARGAGRPEEESSFLSAFAIEGGTVHAAEDQKNERLASRSAEEDVSLMTLDPALLAPAVNRPVQSYVVPVEASSSPMIALEDAALPDQERGARAEANLIAPKDLREIRPLGEDGMGERKVPSVPVEASIGREKGSFSADNGSAVTLLVEEGLRPERTENAGPPDDAVERGAHSDETRFLTGRPADERQKEDLPPWVRSGPDQKGSEETEARLGSERSTPSDLFSNERIGAIGADTHFSGAHAGDRIEGSRLADPTQSKERTGAPLGGMSNETQLLRQIADKWAVSHMKNGHSFRLQLEPERLGALQIDISVHQERITAEIVTKHPFVKELLEGNQELLKGTLAEQGLKVDRFSVHIGDPGQTSFGWEDHLRQRGGGLLYESPERSLPFGMEREEISPQPIWIKDQARGGISLYV